MHISAAIVGIIAANISPMMHANSRLIADSIATSMGNYSTHLMTHQQSIRHIMDDYSTQSNLYHASLAHIPLITALQATLDPLAADHHPLAHYVPQ